VSPTRVAFKTNGIVPLAISNVPRMLEYRYSIQYYGIQLNSKEVLRLFQVGLRQLKMKYYSASE
jgi:hypothetical protein